MVKVLYVAGSGRSGSTIVDNVLGQLEGVVSVGELRFLWERGVLGDRLCGCGRPFSSCPFWRAVMQDVGAVDAPRMVELLARGTRARHVPWLVRARRRPTEVGARLDGLADALGRLYAAIAERAGARVIVDSSKLPPYGELLRHVPGVEPFVVHLVRDPRATAYSWLRRKALPVGDRALGDRPLGDRPVGGRPVGDGSEMQRQGAAKSAGLWTLWNGVAEGWWRGDPERYLRVRYEDFVATPRPVLAKMLAMVGESAAALPFVSPTQVELAPTHGVAGNPSRFTTGVVTVRADTEWRERMRVRDRVIVDAISWPLLLRHGYLGREDPRAGPGRAPDPSA